MKTANQNNNSGTQQNAAAEVEVLYQKMGDRWFAFSVVGEEVFVGSISQEEIDQAEKNDQKIIKSGNA